MKYSIITLLALLSINCSRQSNENQSVFLQKFSDKSELLNHGYSTPKVTNPADASFFDERTRKDFLDAEKVRVANLLSKKIGDTNVCYKIKNGKVDAEIISIGLKHADTVKLFALLDTLGFQRTIKSDGRHSLFVNEKASISYTMAVHTYYVQFENDFGQPADHTPVPPMDSTVRGNKN